MNVVTKLLASGAFSIITASDKRYSLDRATRDVTLRLALLSLVLLALSALAFWPAYLSKFRGADVYTHVHASLGAAWLLLLLVQPLLIRARRLQLHRLIGRAAAAIGAAFVVSSILIAHRSAARMDPTQFSREGYSLYLPFVMAAIFTAAFVLGIAWRAVPAVHGRFMACTALPLLDPLFSRILYYYFPPLPALFLYQIPAFIIVGGLLVALWRSIPLRSPGRQTFLAFSLATVVALLLFFVTPYSTDWFEFVSWFRFLPLT